MKNQSASRWYVCMCVCDYVTVYFKIIVPQKAHKAQNYFFIKKEYCTYSLRIFLSKKLFIENFSPPNYL